MLLLVLSYMYGAEGSLIRLLIRDHDRPGWQKGHDRVQAIVLPPLLHRLDAFTADILSGRF